MTSIAEINKLKVQEEYMKYCIYTGEGDGAFIILAQNYKASPSKKKAIALWQTFLTRDAEFYCNMSSATEKKVAELKPVIDEMVKLKAEADQMDFFSRWTSSKSRKAAPEVFEDLLPMIEKPGSGAGLESLIKFDPKKKADQQQRVIEGAAMAKKFMTAWEKHRAALEKVGFPVKGVKSTLK